MTTNANINKVYPGMLDSSFEFFRAHNGLKVMSSGTVYDFHEIPITIYQFLKEKMESEPEVHTILKGWFPDSELQQLEKFAECRFGGLDFTPDIINHVAQESEYWDCPLRGVCKGEGKVCKHLKYNGEIIDAMDIKIMRLIAAETKNEVISEIVDVPYGSFHKIKTALYKKLDNANTKEKAVLVAHRLNLI